MEELDLEELDLELEAVETSLDSRRLSEWRENILGEVVGRERALGVLGLEMFSEGMSFSSGVCAFGGRGVSGGL